MTIDDHPIVPGFEIEREIGRGGMGVVFLARQEFPSRRVALKVIARDLAADVEFRARFVNETEAAASTEHPNIVPVYAAGEAGDTLYLAMRYVEGTDLSTRLLDGPLPPAEAIAICAQVAAALDTAHRRGLVHRDVKPGNVLLDGSGHAYLSDFGLMRRTDVDTSITKTGSFMGSLDYCAPEQIRGDPLDGRADVYSLGCVLYECLTGSPPYRRDSQVATLYAHLQEPPPRAGEHVPTTPKALDAVVSKAMAKRPEDRYASAADLAAAMRLVVDPVTQSRRRASRAWGVAAAIVLGVVALIAVVVLPNDDEAGSPTGRASPTFSASPSAGPPAFEQGLLVVDAETGAELARYPGSFATSQFFSQSLLVAGSGALWTTDANENLTRIDPVTGETTSIETPGCTVNGLAVDQGALWVVCPGSTVGTVLRIDPFDLSVKEIETPASVGPTNGVVSGEGTLWFCTGSLVRVDQLDRRAEFVEGIVADDLAFTDGALWVADRLTSEVSRLDPSTTEVVETFELSGDIDDMVGGLGGVWVLDDSAGTVTRIDTRSGEIDAPIGVGPGANWITTGFGAVWVTVPDEGTLLRIDPLTDAVTTYEQSAAVVAAIAETTTDTMWLLV